MTPDTLSSLETRLRKLEKQNRLLTTSLLLGVLLVACTSAMITRQPLLSTSEIRANRFVLVDSKDREIGTWTSEDGYASLTFDRDQRRRGGYGRAALRLQENREGAELTLTSNSSDQASLTVKDRQEASLQLYRHHPSGCGDHVLLLAAPTPTVQITAENKARLSLSTGTSQVLKYRDSMDQLRLSLLEDSVNLKDSRLNFLDRSDKPLLTLPGNPPPPSGK